MRGLRTAFTAGLATAFVVVIPGSAPAASIHNVPGDFATIQAAIDAAVSGDTIQIEAGTYPESLDTLGKDLTIEGVAAETVVIMGSGNTAVHVHNGETVTIREVTVDGGAGIGVRVDDATLVVESSIVQNHLDGGIFVEGNTSTISVTGSLIRDNTGCIGGIRFEHGPTATIVGNTLEGNGRSVCSIAGAHGITLWSNNGVSGLVADNRVSDNVDGGVYIRMAGSVVERNVIAGNGEIGLTIGPFGAEVHNNAIQSQFIGIDLRAPDVPSTITHNTVADNVTQIWAAPTHQAMTVLANNVFAGDGESFLMYCSATPQEITFVNNIAWNPGGSLRAGGCPANGIDDAANVDPLLVDPGGGDVSLSFGSPAIDAADPAYPAAVDVAGNPRPVDGDGDATEVADIGAHEFDPGPQYAHGFVTSELDGRAIPGACVMLFDGATKVAETKTNEVGGFSITHDAGSYKIKYADCRWRLHRPTFSGGPTFQTSTPVTLLPAGAAADAVMELFASCDGQKPTIIGTDGDDTLIGTPGNDVISGAAGNDVLVGLDGADTLCGGKGKDTLQGDAGPDLLIGGNDGDILDGGGGHDSLLGGGGWDRLIGGFGNDDLQGGPQTDTADYSGSHVGVVVRLPALTATGPGTDSLGGIENVTGSSYADTIIGNATDNVLRGGDGDDEIHAGAGDDEVYGGPGVDLIGGGPGSDLLESGSWNAFDDDIVTFARAPAGMNIVINGGGGTATYAGDVDTLSRFRKIVGSPYPDDIFIQGREIATVSGGGGNDEITVESFLIRQATIWGDGGSDVIWVGPQAGETMIFGGPGNDFLTGRSERGTFGEAGDDQIDGSGLLVGGPGHDTIKGSGGADLLFGEEGNDRLEGGYGNDLLVGGPGADTILGQNGEDTLIGEAGPDELRGGGDDDVLSGGPGDDSLMGGLGDDWVTFELSPFPVTVDLGANSATGNGTDTFGTIEFIFGSEYDDTINGSWRSDLLVGWLGNDVIFGRAGHDVLDGMEGTDDLNGQAGTDLCYNGETHTGCETIEVFPDAGFDLVRIPPRGLLEGIRPWLG